MRESVREAIEDAINRFSGATDEIRQSASSIRRELEDTRSELKRGAFDLPEETRESAAAMRRAVSDQIKALQELSQIVGQSSHRTEVSEPRHALPRARQPCSLPPHRRHNARPGATRHPHRAPKPQAQRAPLRGSLEPAGAAPAKSQGWVSDLLRGASREEEHPCTGSGGKQDARAQSAPCRRIAQLAVCRHRPCDRSRRLGRSVGRYQRGERNVFTRRLYTLKGQQTFDEIKRKYEAAIRNSVLQSTATSPISNGCCAMSQERPRQHHDADLPHLGHRQGLHHAGPRQRTLRPDTHKRKS
jgi:hypothetical protein